MGNVFDWVQDEFKDGDSKFENDGFNIIMSENDMKKSKVINIRVEEFPWGDDLVIGSTF
ncbi:MAG: hypothetical protein Q4P31_05445 [Andreesenia angusta]|nr:hypothetical protein [Andreesenia angusta]